MTVITLNDIIITLTVITGGGSLRDNFRGGALTEVTFYILLALYEPRHGYAVMQFIEERTGGRLTLGAGTLYGALNTLEARGWIAPFGHEAGGRKKSYLITDAGRDAAEKERIRLSALLKTADEIMEGTNE